jgi:hypothetical protein
MARQMDEVRTIALADAERRLQRQGHDEERIEAALAFLDADLTAMRDREVADSRAWFARRCTSAH